MNFMPRLAVLLAIALLAGCASTYQPMPPVNLDYTVRVNQPVSDIENGSRVDFQMGQRVIPGNLDRWSTHCGFHVFNHLQGQDYVTSIEPGDFQISAIRMDYRPSDFREPRHHHLYSEGSWGVRDAPSFYVYFVQMRLTSPDQPDVQGITCAKKWSVPRADEFPTLEEIQRAFGQHASIEAPS